MLGAIIGDLAGSIYEFDQVKQHSKVKVNNLIENSAFYSDDTILTVAIADAILNNVDYEEKLREYALLYNDAIPQDIPYFETMFSPNFVKWAKREKDGTSEGNGAMMRISPVGFLFDSEDDVIKNAYLATIPSHNSESAIKCAKTIALIIFYARKGLSKSEIINKLNLKIVEPKITHFNYTCQDTIDLCLYCIFQANSFEDSMKLAISYGGDTDTNACIVGSMAEAFYGIDNKLKQKAISKLPPQFIQIINKFYQKIK